MFPTCSDTGSAHERTCCISPQPTGLPSGDNPVSAVQSLPGSASHVPVPEPTKNSINQLIYNSLQLIIKLMKLKLFSVVSMFTWSAYYIIHAPTPIFSCTLITFSPLPYISSFTPLIPSILGLPLGLLTSIMVSRYFLGSLLIEYSPRSSWHDQTSSIYFCSTVSWSGTSPLLG